MSILLCCTGVMVIALGLWGWHWGIVASPLIRGGKIRKWSQAAPDYRFYGVCVYWIVLGFAFLGGGVYCIVRDLNGS